nr:putative leader peptide [Streptomyces sp. TLI_235]
MGNETIRIARRGCRSGGGNLYDEPMRSVDVTNQAPGIRLVARLHVDLCRLASAICPGTADAH